MCWFHTLPITRWARAMPPVLASQAPPGTQRQAGCEVPAARVASIISATVLRAGKRLSGQPKRVAAICATCPERSIGTIRGPARRPRPRGLAQINSAVVWPAGKSLSTLQKGVRAIRATLRGRSIRAVRDAARRPGRRGVAQIISATIRSARKSLSGQPKGVRAIRATLSRQNIGTTRGLAQGTSVVPDCAPMS